MVEGDKKLVEKFMNKLIEYYCAVNLGVVDVPKFMMYSVKEIDKNLADRDKVLTEQGVNFTKEYYMESYNLKEGDFDLRSKEIVKGIS